MLISSLLVLSGLLLGVTAQNVGPTTSQPPTKTISDEATATSLGTGLTTHTINVGASGHKMTKDNIKAEVGDIIEWRFYPDAHWVIRGDFNNPCIPYEYVETDRRGFSSGPQSVKAITDDAPRFRVRVNDTEPIFYYCGAPGSCVNYHMMGVINESQNQTLKEWLVKAEGVDYQLRPGDPFPTERDFRTNQPTATNDAGGGGATSNGDKDDEGSGLGAGAIAGIVIGATAVLILAGGLLYICGRRGGFDKAYRKSFRSSTATGGTASTGGPVMTESQYGSPITATADVWSGYKQPNSMASGYGQSPPVSPQPTPGYGYQPQPMIANDGTVGSYYSEHHAQYLTPPPHHHQEPPKPDNTPPVELPASSDPGNSPLPSYSNGDQRTFSWAGEESAYRPTKSSACTEG